MKPDLSILIVTPVFIEDLKIIERCLNSIKKQNSICHIKHLLIFDGISRVDLPEDFETAYPNTVFRRCTYNHDDYGDYIRRIGTRIAICKNYDALSYLDIDNYLSQSHVERVVEKFYKENKNIIISKRRIFSENGPIENEDKSNFFDTNTITFFGEAMKIGLLWGKYPKELSLIGDRIISKYITKNYTHELSFLNEPLVNYTFSKIPNEKINHIKDWYKSDYKNIKKKFLKHFGFNLTLK